MASYKLDLSKLAPISLPTSTAESSHSESVLLPALLETQPRSFKADKLRDYIMSNFPPHHRGDIMREIWRGLNGNSAERPVRSSAEFSRFKSPTDISESGDILGAVFQTRIHCASSDSDGDSLVRTQQEKEMISDIAKSLADWKWNCACYLCFDSTPFSGPNKPTSHSNRLFCSESERCPNAGILYQIRSCPVFARSCVEIRRVCQNSRDSLVGHVTFPRL